MTTARDGDRDARRDPPPGYVPALGIRWLTPLYDAVVAATTRERAVKAALLDQASPRAGQRVLDLACGTGTLALALSRRFPETRLAGVDGDPAILAIARRKAARAGIPLALTVGRAEALPYADGRFDIVLSSLFFHHLTREDKLRAAREAARVLRPGGELHVADWGRAANPAMRGLFVVVQLLDGFATTRDNVAGRLPALFEEAGFTGVAETRRFATPLGTLSLYRAARPG